MELSIIIPVYNTEEYISDCIDSVISQKGIDFEIICVDDNSTDNSFSILKTYEKQYPGIVTVYQIRHQGVSVARNFGLKYARGKYIYYMDSDDILTDGSLVYMYETCVYHDLDVLFFSFENFTDEIKMQEKYSTMLCKKNKRSYVTSKAIKGSELFIQFQKWSEYYVTVWCQCVRREFALNCGLFFPEGFAFEDRIYTFRLLEAAQKAMCTDKIIYRKRIRSDSICTNIDLTDYFIGSFQTVFYLSRWLEKANPGEFTDYVNGLLKDSKKKLFTKLFRSENKAFYRYTDLIFLLIRDYILSSSPHFPLVSLCIPTMGVSKWIFAVLDSVYAMNISTDLFEVVVTNNGKEDETFDRRIDTYRVLFKNLHYKRNTSKLFYNEIESYKLASGQMIKFINHRTTLNSHALKYYIICSYLLNDTKPVIYFSNGVLKNCIEKQSDSFSHFLTTLGYWSSWSTGMCFWKSEFDSYKDKSELFDSLFPHTNILFYNQQGKYFIIENRELLYELPVGAQQKGKYDVFYAFAVRYVEIYRDLLYSQQISEEDYDILLKNLLEYIAFIYYGYVICKKPTSYILSGYQQAINVYFSHSQVQRIIDNKFPVKTQNGIQCRIIKIDIVNVGIPECLNWHEHREIYVVNRSVETRLAEMLRGSYKFVEEKTVVISETETELEQSNKMNGYLDKTVDYVVINPVSNNRELFDWVLKCIASEAINAEVLIANKDSNT